MCIMLTIIIDYSYHRIGKKYKYVYLHAVGVVMLFFLLSQLQIW